MTLAIFVAGLLTGIWTQNIRVVPPPPLPPLGEMRGFDRSAPPGAKFPLPPGKAAEIEAAMARLRPQMEAFEKKLQEIESTFRSKVDAILTPEQLAILKAKPAPPSELPPFAAQTPDRMMKPMGGMAFFTIITPVAEHFSKELNLTPEQRTQLLKLLQERRQQFFDLVDANPPPSLELRHVAPGAPPAPHGDGH